MSEPGWSWRKVFRAEDAAAGAWWEAEAVLCFETGQVGWERVGALFPPGYAAEGLMREADRQTVRWARRLLGRDPRPRDGWVEVADVS